MNEKQVKQVLPSVPIRINNKGETLYARLSGRLNKTATVTVINEGTRHKSNYNWIDQHFSWQAMTRAINTNRPLNFEVM